MLDSSDFINTPQAKLQATINRDQFRIQFRSLSQNRLVTISESPQEKTLQVKRTHSVGMMDSKNILL